MTDQSPNDVFHASSFMQGHNAEYIEQLYARYADNPNAVDESWRAFFASLGDAPADVIALPDGSAVYVPNRADDSVSVIDTSSNTVTTTLNVGNNPTTGVALPDGETIYTANVGDGSVSVIDTATNTVTETIETPFIRPGATSPDGSKVYLISWGEGLLLTIDTSTNEVSSSLAVGDNPTRVDVLPDGSAVYVTTDGDLAEEGGGAVAIVDAAAENEVATVAVGGAPSSLGVLPDGSAVYVNSPESDKAYVLGSP